MMYIKEGWRQWFTSFLIKYLQAVVPIRSLTSKSMLNQLQLANELHKRIIRKFKRRGVYSSFISSISSFISSMSAKSTPKDNIWV